MNKVISIKMYLFFTILILSLLPMAASYFFLEDVLEGALNIGLNEKINNILEAYQLDLKKLKYKDAENVEDYRNRFFEIQEMKAVYSHPEYLKSQLKKAYISYFSIGFVLVMIVSLITAFYLSRTITLSYQNLTETLLRKSKRLHQLENIDEWQEIAGKLAHEIKNPLTPIEIMVSSLLKSYVKKKPEDFEVYLKETQDMVKQEISKLKEMVHSFSEFSKLPNSSPKTVNFPEFLHHFVEHYGETWPQATFSINLRDLSDEMKQYLAVSLDPGLFKQVLINLLNNAVQANPTTTITIDFGLTTRGRTMILEIVNGGKSISEQERKNLFKVYYTTRNSKDNMGLGLPIVQKIIWEHNGDIQCLPLQSGAGFSISLPIEEDRKNEQKSPENTHPR